MRSTLLHFAGLIVPLALAGGLTVAACADSQAASKFANQADDSPGSSGEGPSFGVTDASAGPKAPATRGSPLCGVTADKCLPDDDGTKATSSPQDYGHCATDAGAPTPDASIATGCRLKRAGTEYTPYCFENEANHRGLDGVPCERGSDCAPGFDCVDGEMGSICRRYCCMGSCEGQAAQNGGPTFCDIQRLVDPDPHNAPVCMPLKTCKLLVGGECGDKETCAVVTEKGVTGCVPRGSAKAGESCDEEHCNVDLTCLGNPGDRRCYKLCKTEGSRVDCAPTQTCTTGSVFQDNTFGVCKEN